MKPTRQLGFGLIVYGIMVIAIIGVIGGIHVTGYKAGIAHEQKEQAVRNAEAAEAERVARLAREDEARKASAALASADRRARDADSRWRAARSSTAPVASAVCPADFQPHVGGLRSPSIGAVASAGAVRLTPHGVGLWDSAWTDKEGKPVFGHTGELAARSARPDAALPTIEQAIDNHAENASRASENSRQLKGLIDLLKRLRSSP